MAPSLLLSKFRMTLAEMGFLYVIFLKPCDLKIMTSSVPLTLVLTELAPLSLSAAQVP